jgi:hypothetical protein
MVEKQLKPIITQMQDKIIFFAAVLASNLPRLVEFLLRLSKSYLLTTGVLTRMPADQGQSLTSDAGERHGR